jgi:hypothetical protein
MRRTSSVEYTSDPALEVPRSPRLAILKLLQDPEEDFDIVLVVFRDRCELRNIEVEVGSRHRRCRLRVESYGFPQTSQLTG